MNTDMLVTLYDVFNLLSGKSVTRSFTAVYMPLCDLPDVASSISGSSSDDDIETSVKQWLKEQDTDFY
jgi:hypothetical protein